MNPLTDALDRERLEELVTTALAAARGRGDHLALLFLRVSGPSSETADAFAAAVVDRLRGRLRRGDPVARVGADEYVVVLPDLDRHWARHEAERVADQLVVRLAAPVPLPGGAVSPRVTAGLCVYPDDGTDVGALLRTAERHTFDRAH